MLDTYLFAAFSTLIILPLICDSEINANNDNNRQSAIYIQRGKIKLKAITVCITSHAQYQITLLTRGML